MEQAITEMHNNLTDEFFIAFVSENQNPYFALIKSDEIEFLDDKRILVRKKSGQTSIINLNLIIEISTRRLGAYE